MNSLWPNTGYYSVIRWLSGLKKKKNPPANAGDTRDADLIPGLGKSSWSRKCQAIPVFFPGKFHRQRNLVGQSPWGQVPKSWT